MIGYRIFTASAVALLISGPAAGQDAPPRVAEPEYNFVVFALDANTGALIPLERKQGNIQAKVRAMGFGGAKGSTVFAGESSPVRFKESQKLEFVIRVESTGNDPATLVSLEALTRSKGKRELQTMQVGAFSGHVDTTNGKSAQGLSFAKYGEHSFRFTPSDALPKGEYAVMTKGSTESFLFGID
jgi:hypothetical protein